MAIKKRYTHLNLTGSNHSQLDAELAYVTGTLGVGGAAKFMLGLSGSLTNLTDGSSYLVAGPNITITSASNGQVTIEATSGGGTSPQYWDSSVAGAIYTTGSALFRGADSTTAPSDYGTEFNFYVSGAAGSIVNASQGAAGFGGDVYVSGAVYIGALEGLTVSQGSVFTGLDVYSTLGFTGSLTQLTDGRSYLAAGANVTITSESNGQVTISATDTVNPNFWLEASANHIYTTGSADVFVTASFGAGVSGSFNKYAPLAVVRVGSSAGSAELLRVGGLDLTPVTGTAQTLNASGYPLSAIVSGSVLAPPAFRGYITPRAVIRNEVSVTAGSYFSTLADGEAELISFSANYIVNCNYYNGTQYVKSVVEISRDVYDNATGYGADWDANFNANGDVTVTGSVSGGVNPVFWHVQRVKQTGIITDATLDDFSASVAGEAF